MSFLGVTVGFLMPSFNNIMLAVVTESGTPIRDGLGK